MERMDRPNIIYILADDLGYGDLRGYNPDSKIPTSNLDRLATTGLRFTDAHAASALCTPSRYNGLTGRYGWRSRLKQGIVWEYDGALIEPERQTVAHLLQQQGYATACFGKWHLGLDWTTRDGRHPNDTLPFGKYAPEVRHAYQANIDFNAPFGGGPIDRGFDHYFGVDVPNFPPYTWFENDQLTPPPDSTKPPDMYGHDGPALAGWLAKSSTPLSAPAPPKTPSSSSPATTDPSTLPATTSVPGNASRGMGSTAWVPYAASSATPGKAVTACPFSPAGPGTRLRVLSVTS